MEAAFSPAPFVMDVTPGFMFAVPSVLTLVLSELIASLASLILP
jgi:hypothetical protein